MTQRDDGHDYRDSKNKAIEYERKKKEKEKEKLDYCIAHADYLYDKLMTMIVYDFKNQKDNFGEKDFLSKLTKKELEKYVEDQILADGFLVADEE